MAESMTWQGWRGAAAWSGVVALNLAVPLPLGLLATRYDGQIGVGLGVLACWAVGLIVCLQSARLGPVLIRGGAWVGLLQLFPMLQVAAGLSAVLVWEAVSGSGPGRPAGLPAALAGFVLTIATAVLLLLAAFLFGGGLRLLRAVPGTEQVADFGETVRPASGD